MNLKEKYKDIITNNDFTILDSFGKPDLDEMIKLSIDNKINIDIVVEFFVDKYKDKIITEMNK